MTIGGPGATTSVQAAATTEVATTTALSWPERGYWDRWRSDREQRTDIVTASILTERITAGLSQVPCAVIVMTS